MSFNAMYDTSGSATIRVRAQINGMSIHALIDGGSSNSFLQPIIAKFLNLTAQPVPGFCVMVGNFELMTTNEYIPSIEVIMQGYTVQILEVYVVNVARGDMVNGTTWLKQLGAHIVEYQHSFIRFLHEGAFVTIFGKIAQMSA